MGSSKRKKKKNGPKLNDWDHAQTVRKLDDQLNFGLKAPQNIYHMFFKKKKKKLPRFSIIIL